MSPVIITLLVLLGVGLLIALWLMYIYNGLVVAGNRFKNAFAQIDVQLKRRYELIPNLVEAVKGYMGHERRRHQGPQQREGGRAESRRQPQRPGGHEGA